MRRRRSPGAKTDDLSHPDLRPTDQTPRLVLVAGGLYLAAILFRDWILQACGVPTQVTPDYLQHFAVKHVITTLALRMPALAVIWLIWVRHPESRLRASLRAETPRAVMWTLVLTVGLSFVLNLFGVWPFMWLWATDSTSTYVGVLVSSRQWLAIPLWILIVVVVGPVIEELVFRFGVLQTVRDWTGSSAKAVIASSVIFALGHLGYLPADRAHIVNATWLFGASLALGKITLDRTGRVTLSLTAHVARNALEVSLLFLLVRPGAV